MKMPSPTARTTAKRTAFTTNMVNPLRQWAPDMQTRAAVSTRAAVALAVALACSHHPAAIVHTDHGSVRITIEVAADDATRTRGLMYRTELADGHGMLFVFDDVTDHAFWMKNTVIPLDMIFIGPDHRIV